MTPKTSNDVNDFEPQERHSQQPRSQARFQTVSDNKESPKSSKFYKYCRRNGHSFSRCFKRHTKKPCQINLESRQQNDAEPEAAAQKMFRDFFKNNQDLPKTRALNSYVSPHKPYKRPSSESPLRNRNFTSRQSFSS